MKTPDTFKRIAIGDKFTSRGERYRKTTDKGAIRLLPNGRGQTHATVRFARSTAVAVDVRDIRVLSAARDGITPEV